VEQNEEREREKVMSNAQRLRARKQRPVIVVSESLRRTER
jgi:hypothetical protein